MKARFGWMASSAVGSAEIGAVECGAPKRAAIDRSTEQERTGRSIAVARAALFPDRKRAFDPIDEIPSAHHPILHTGRPVDEWVEQVPVGCNFPFPDPIFA